ncbi:SAM-dependent methyltransferase [Smaragdicoccus niigatensis]|uniref:SAM-dependent methyltransferase n=1 Tax=Smaragdicoccus niigatensis TaxID=359359 RepID=UPI000378C352|nr:cyclopropane-fatty-acyl-phospholipid synthase family protein [Smaragdicoccus niigatensis]
MTDLAVTTTSRPSDPVAATTNWPDVSRVPRYTWRSSIARILVRHAVQGLPLRIELPGGEILGGGSSDSPTIFVTNPEAFYARLGRDGLIGFGESFMAGEWYTADAESLTAVLTILASNVATLVPASWQRLRRFAVRHSPLETRDWRRAAREDIAAHYDLSNDMFASFLDSTMTYSSALFDDPLAASWSDLIPAQHAKIDRLLDGAVVGAGTRLLEIGTGWGELALRAAQRGAHVTTVTLSAEQASLARQRITEAGVGDRVEVRLQDYRDVAGQFDAIVSVEMVEAVGYDQWPTYFSTLDRLLAPGGKIGLQAITMPDDRLEATRHTYTWIQKYIFPGGLLLSTEAIARTLRSHTSLWITDRLEFGPHYAATLRLWRERFDAADSTVFGDEVFRRMWQFYLCYARAGFESGYLDVQQFLLEGTR